MAGKQLQMYVSRSLKGAFHTINDKKIVDKNNIKREKKKKLTSGLLGHSKELPRLSRKRLMLLGVLDHHLDRLLPRTHPP